MNMTENPDESVDRIPDELNDRNDDSSVYEKDSGADPEDIEIIDKASEPSYTLDVERDQLPVKEKPETDEDQAQDE
ncbi:MAG: hypothetical protein JWN56_1512 [Sphingobacteriales bacterium]|nr:hypothetical protein [Sphingobacteriales bacterium]